MPSGSTRAPPRSSPTRCGGSSTSRSGCSRPCAPAPRRRHRTGSWPPCRRTGWNASSSGRCTSRRSIGCSRSGSGGRFRASCWSGSRRRRAATRSMRWSSAARCSGTGSRPTPTGRSPCPTAWARSSPAACRDSRSRPADAMLLAAAAAEPTVETLERASPGIEARPAAGGRRPTRRHRGWRRPVRAPAVRAVGAEPRAGGRASVGARSPVRGDAVRGRPGPPSRARGGRPGRDRRGDPRTGRRARPQPRRDPRRREPLPGGEPPDALGRSGWPRSTEPASPPSACSSTCPSTSRPTGSSRRRSIGPRPAPRAPTRSACARSSATTTGACPQAIELGEQALDEAGDDPGLRAKVLGRLGVPRDAARPRARGRPGRRGRRDHRGGRRRRAGRSRHPCERPAPARQRRARARAADPIRRRRARARPDLGRRPIVGEGGGRGLRVRAGSRHRRPGPRDRDDPGD